jgi:hypothetical protein
MALFLPLLFIGFALNGWLHSELPLTVLMALFSVILFCLSVWSFVTYYHWTGKYPSYWLRR